MVILNYSLGNRLPGIIIMKMKEIAAAAGVSAATVSKILNGRDEHISEATRNRVLQIVDKTGYMPNAIAKSLKQNRSKMIGFILPDISNPFFPSVAKGMEEMAHEYGYGILIANTNDSIQAEQEALRFLSSRQVGGIVFARALKSDTLEKCVETELPIVAVDRALDFDAPGMGRIIIDTSAGIAAATNVLIDSGCKRIAYISARYNSKTDRYFGYCRALENAGLELDEALIYNDTFTFETGYNGVSAILSRTEADGIICGNDLIAVGAISRLREFGISVPEQMKVMGFDDIYFSRYMTPPLSTVRQPAYEMGAESAKMLIDYLEKGTALYNKKLDFSIVMRGTV